MWKTLRSQPSKPFKHMYDFKLVSDPTGGNETTHIPEKHACKHLQDWGLNHDTGVQSVRQQNNDTWNFYVGSVIRLISI